MNKDELKPMLLTTLKGYTAQKFAADAVAGLIVAIIALPLSIALALASGVGPEQGIYTAIVAGFLISMLGGSQVQIAGPTAAFATIVAGIVMKNGMDGLVLATVIAGILLILMGLFRFGSLIRYIPYTITMGFTAGIAVTIIIGQLKDFLGITYPKGTAAIETMEKLTALVRNSGTMNPTALAVGIASLLILMVWPKVSEKIPGSLIAVIAASAAVKCLGLPVNTIGDLYSISNALPPFRLPEITFEGIHAAAGNGVTIAILAAIESLLSCVVADGMVGGKHRSNMELVAQGVGNIGSALFGGIPATGAIARTAANIKNGGRSPIAGMIHAVILVLVLVFLMPYAALIPMPTIAAILFMVAYNMSGWRMVVLLTKTAPKSDIVILLITFALTVIFDLVMAIEVGMILACILFMKRMSDESGVMGWKYFDPADGDKPEDEQALRSVPKEIRVFEIFGPMFFGNADQLAAISPDADTRCIVLRMRGVPAIDASALRSLSQFVDRCTANGTQMVFSHVNEQPWRAMEKFGLIGQVGEENFAPHIGEALKLAEAKIS